MQLVAQESRDSVELATWRSRLTPHRALVLVAVLHGLVALPSAIRGTHLLYDEIIYVSQFGSPYPVTMTAPRAWGMPLLLAPVDIITSSPLVIRMALLALSVVAIYLAFRPWLSAAGAWVAPIAAGLFTTLWTTLLFASMAYPNIWIAYCAVGGIGLALVVRERPTALGLWGVAAVFAAASLIRPLDALLAAVPVGLLVLWERRRSLVLAVGGGVAVGWAAWAFEAFVRFDDPIHRLREVSRINDNGLFLRPWHLLVSADGPQLQCRPITVCGDIDLLGVAWLVALPFLAIAGIAVARDRLPLLVVTAAAGLIAAEYAFGSEWSHPRFLIPAYALLALPVATLVVRAIRAGRAVAVVVILLVVAHGAVQANLLRQVDRELDVESAEVEAIVATIERAGVEPPCTVFHVSTIGPAFELGCRPVPARERPDPQSPDVVEALAAGDRVVLVFRGRDVPDAPGWESFVVSGRPVRTILVSSPAPAPI